MRSWRRTQTAPMPIARTKQPISWRGKVQPHSCPGRDADHQGDDRDGADHGAGDVVETAGPSSLEGISR